MKKLMYRELCRLKKGHQDHYGKRLGVMYEAISRSEYIGISRYRDRIYALSDKVGMVTCQQTEVVPRKIYSRPQEVFLENESFLF